MFSSRKFRTRAAAYRNSVSALALMAGLASFGAAGPASAQEYTLIQPITFCDGGGNCTTDTVLTGAIYEQAIETIYAQAGVTPIILSTTQVVNASMYDLNGIAVTSPATFTSYALPATQDPNNGTNAVSGYTNEDEIVHAWIVNSFVGAGGLFGEATGIPPGFPLWNDEPGFVLSEPAITGFSTVGRIDTPAHELGHVYGLGHNTLGAGGATNLMTSGGSRSVPQAINQIFPTGTLSVLTSGAGQQIETVQASPFVLTAVDCTGTAGSDNFTLNGGDVCVNIFGLADNDLIVLNLDSAVLANVEGGSGSDLIAVNPGSQVFGSVDGGSDGDFISVGGRVRGDVLGGSGNDIIDTYEPARVQGNVDGQSGNDIITIASDPVDVLGGTGDDVITLNTGAVVANVYGDDNDNFEGDDGADIIVMNDGLVLGNVDAEGANDIIRIFGGQVDGSVLGGGGDDLFEIAGGSIGTNVEGQNGEDIFNLSGGSIGGNVEGGNDNDTYVLTGTLVSGDLSGGNGEDSFTLAGGSVGGDVSGGNNADTFLLTGSAISGDLEGGNGNDVFTVTGGSVGGDVSGGNNSDTLLMTGGSVSGNVSGGNDGDTLTLEGGSVAGNVTGGNGGDSISLFGTSIGGDVDGGNNNDEIIQTAGSVAGNVSGGFNNDVIRILGGTVGGSVFGNEGDDIIETAEPGTVLGNVDGGEDDDIITIASDPVDVLGGTGNDVISIVNGAIVTGSVYGDDNDGFEGDDGNDVIAVSGGLVLGGVFGEGGSDFIGLSGGFVLGGLSGGGGDDGLLITGGITSNVSGNAGNDIAVWTHGLILSWVDMGTGTDSLDIYGANAGGTALQAGLVFLDGGDDAASGDGQVDTLTLHGVVEVLTDLRNWEFINLTDTSIGDLGQASRTIVTEQFFVEAGSTLVATGNAGATQTYVIDGDLWNDGTIEMRDGAPSYDVLEATGTYTGGPGSILSTDTFLGGVGSPSDLMVVGTATTGETALHVFDTNAGPGAYNPDGIPLVDVSAGTTDANDFVLVNGFTGLGGPIDKGLFFYDLALRPDNVHVLIGVPDLEAFQLARAPAQAQAAWHRTTGVWLDRTADLRAYLDNSAASGPNGPVSPGFWVRAVRSYLDRDDETTFSLFNKSYTWNTSYDQNIYGGFAGADHAWNDVFEPGDAGLLGLFVGYGGWDSRFKQQSAGGGHTTVDGSGLSFGLYGTWLNRGFFVDGVFKADLPEIDVRAPGLAPFAPIFDRVDSVVLGGVLDSGYRHAFGHNAYVEGLGTLSYVNTDIDPALLGGTSVDFGTDRSLRGRLGLALGGTFHAGDAVTLMARASASAWHEFDGDNGTDLFSPGGAPLDLGDDLGGTFGEISGLVDIYCNRYDMSFFIKTDYRFGQDTSELAGSLGFRFAY